MRVHTASNDCRLVSLFDFFYSGGITRRSMSYGVIAQIDKFRNNEFMKRYLSSHLPMAIWYSLIVFVLNGITWPLSAQMLTWVWWVVGVVVGVMILFLDRLVYVYSYPNEQLSRTVIHHYAQKDYVNMLAVLDLRRNEQNKLTFRSALFMVVWVLLAFFALTSTAGLFGKGVVMGLMLHILIDAWRLQKIDSQRLNERLFWQIGRTVRMEEQLVLMYAVSALFVIFSFWVA